MIKRILSVALVAIMVIAMATVGVSAADTTTESTGTSGYIYFNSAGWNNVTEVYCHIWIVGSDSFYGWKDPGERCEKVSGTMWKYDLSKLDDSPYISGGLKAGVDYCVIFHALKQTYDTTFGTECIGDRLSLTGKEIENPVDSQKTGAEAVWAKNSSKYGPHFAISSVGNFLGSKLAPHETGTKVIGDWLVGFSASQFCDPVEVLTRALPKLGVKDINAVMAYIMTKSSLGVSEPDTMQAQLEKAYKAAYGEEVKIDDKKVAEKKQTIESSGGDTNAASDDTSSSTGSSSNNGYSSGSGADGQDHTIFFVLASVMVLAAGAYFVTRKRREV